MDAWVWREWDEMALAALSDVVDGVRVAAMGLFLFYFGVYC